MIILAILATIIVGWIGAVIGLEIMNGFTELGSILAVATMGAFIMMENKQGFYEVHITYNSSYSMSQY